MAGLDQKALAAAMPWETDPFSILKPGEATRAEIPEAWFPIAESADPAGRTSSALALWNNEFLAMVPGFARALRNDLIDVRVTRHQWIDAPSLDYVVAAADGYAVWMGESPSTFGDRVPPLFDSLPAAAQVFLRHVHAGSRHGTANPAV